MTAWDLTHECMCTCHIGWKKLVTGNMTDAERHVDEVTRRIQCTIDSYMAEPLGDAKFCITCGRRDANRYQPMNDLDGMNLQMLRSLGIDLSDLKSKNPPRNLLVDGIKRRARRQC